VARTRWPVPRAYGDRIARCASVVSPAPFDADGLDWLDGMSAINVEEFARAWAGETAYRPLVEQLAHAAVAAAEHGALPVADDYALAESEGAVLVAQARSSGHLFRTKAAYTGGIDGCVDDVIAFTRQWNFDIGSIQAPVSIWYGPDDALCPRAHTDWLLQHMPEAEARELPGDHVLDKPSLYHLYTWLTSDP
jgi:pimeloyl-ACP methyl ester carboxylesterase